MERFWFFHFFMIENAMVVVVGGGNNILLELSAVFLEVLHLLLGVGDDGIGGRLPSRGTHLAVLVRVLQNSKKQYYIKIKVEISWVGAKTWIPPTCGGGKKYTK